MNIRKAALLAGVLCVLTLVALILGRSGQEPPRAQTQQKKKLALRGTDTVKPKVLGPVQLALKALPRIEAAPLETGQNRAALWAHLERVKNAPDAAAEAREIEALIAWRNKLPSGNSLTVSLGIRCTELSDEDLLALSSWPVVKLRIGGLVDEPISAEVEVTLKAPRNALRLIPLAVPTRGGLRTR